MVAGAIGGLLAYGFHFPTRPEDLQTLGQALGTMLSAAFAGWAAISAQKKLSRHAAYGLGPRHGRGVEIAYAGGSDAEIMAQLEHASDRQAKEYRRQADRRRLADAGQDRIDNVISIRKTRKKRTAGEREL